MDVDRLGWGIFRKRVRSEVLAKKCYCSNGLWIVLEGKGGNCGFSEQESNFLIILRAIIRIKKPLPRA